MTDQTANRSCGFTRIELLVAIVIIALAIGLVWVALHSAHEGQKGHKSFLRVRGIHTSQIFFAESNNGWFTGFDRDGKLETGHVFNGAPQSASWNGYDQSTPRAPAWRIRRLLENNYISGEYCVSLNETKPFWHSGQSMDPGKFSFAMLKIEGEADSPRKREHKNTANPLAVVVSDRAIRTETGYGSLHTDTHWSGTVCWGDNHASFEETAVLPTRYDKIANKNDDLFTDSSPSGEPNAEAAMAWKSAGDTGAELME